MDSAAELTLLRTVTASDTYASYVQFSYSLHDLASTNSSLSLYVDDVLAGRFDTNVERAVSSEYGLKPGTHVLKWQYAHSPTSNSSIDGAYLHWIAFAGIGEGGAPVCLSCPTGYFSAEGSSVCKPCPAGTTSDKTFSKCEDCQWFQYNDLPGNTDGCQPCPESTMPNSQHTACIGTANITGDYQYSLEPFVSLSSRGSPLLCEKSKFKHRCQDEFFGPVAHNDSYFFLSVLNPGKYSHSSYSRFDNFTSGYAFGLIEKRNLPVSQSDLNMPDEVCASDFSKMVVNLGTRVLSVDSTDRGFNIAYKDGARCDQERRFGSVIHFHCEKAAGDGWPQLLYVSDCVYHFTWDSRLACHACKNTELKYVQGKCFEGERYSFYEENEKCIYPGAGIVLDIQPCSETKEVMKTWPAIIGATAAVFLIVTVCVLIIFCQRTKSKYKRLIEYRDEPNRAGE